MTKQKQTHRSESKTVFKRGGSLGEEVKLVKGIQSYKLPAIK